MSVIAKLIPGFAHKGIFVVQKFSPEVLTVAGVVGVVASGIMASRATLKLEEQLWPSRTDRMDLKNAKGLDPAYTQKDYAKDLTITYRKSAVALVKLYGPSVTLGVLSLGAIVSSHGIMRRRNLGLIAAYKGVEEAYSRYRERVVQEIGEEKEEKLRNDLRAVKQIEFDENGIAKSVQDDKIPMVFDPNTYSQYARFFDEMNSTQWNKSAGQNLLFLKCQQNYANDILHSRGHLFLNEVYKMLGMEHTRPGAVVGWILSKDGDNFVDFGFMNGHSGKAREFVNGNESAVLLDFNVDGVIFDKLKD